MVWLARQDLVCTEELLEQDDTSELVWKRDRAEGQMGVGAIAHARREAERTADHEAEVLARSAALLQKGRQLGARQRLALAIEGADESRVWNSPEHPRPLTLEGLAPPISTQPRLLQLVNLEPRMASEQPLVVSHIIGERRTSQAADADDHDPHPCDTSGQPGAVR
jgi:hypothetical protein